MADRKFVANLANDADFAEKVKILYGEDKLDYQAGRYLAIYDLHSKKFELKCAEIIPTTTTARCFARLSRLTRWLASLRARAR